VIIAPSFGRPGRTLVVAVSALALASCGRGGDSAQQPAAPPPTLVTAVTVRAEAVPNIVDLPGRIEAIRSAEVRARTDGIIERRLYQEGTDVKEGTPLFRIDPRDRQAAVQQAQAAVQRAEATRLNARQVVDRYRPLINERAVSAQEFEAAQATLRQAEAGVADARATLTRAQLELSYTTVRAPISGRVGRAQATEGALASAAQATPLTTIEQLDPVYAVFSQSSSELQTLLSQARAGQIKLPTLTGVEVRLVLESGEEYGPIGRLNFAGLTVDPETGSQVLRASFPNPERRLLPGQFVRGRLLAGTIDGITVPQRAVQINGSNAAVSVVGQDGSVSVRPIQLGGQTGGNWIIRSGLKPGERVIVDGWQKVQPGGKVRVEEPKPAAAGAARPAGQPGQGGTAAQPGQPGQPGAASGPASGR
jgi:membrane fusion protein (multidrug efflux system)